MRKNLTSIIVPCYNQLKYTRRCVESLQNNTAPADYELIFVDNGSTDATNEYLRSIPKAKVVTNKTNFNFSRACNQGIRAARGEYVLLLNNDVVLLEPWLEQLVNCIKSAPDIGMAGPRVNHYASGGMQLLGPATIKNAEDFLSYKNRHTAGKPVKNLEAPVLFGFCLLIKRTILNKIGFLDERFALINDYDFCFRAKEAGYRLFCAGNSFVFHHGGKSAHGGSRNAAKEIHNFAWKWGARGMGYLSKTWAAYHQ